MNVLELMLVIVLSSGVNKPNSVNLTSPDTFLYT